MQKGYTLIELMIAVAIIGILAAVAIVAYVDYGRRAQVAVAIMETEPMRRALDVQYATGEGWLGGNASAGFAGYRSHTIAQVAVQPAAGTRPMTLEVTLAAPWVASGAKLELYPDSASGGYTWRCSSDRGKNLFALLPSSCRDGG